MTQAIRDWLPHEAAANPKLGKAIAPIIDAWSQRWFAAGSLRLGGAAPLAPGWAPASAKSDHHAAVAGDFTHVAIASCLHVSSLALDCRPGDRPAAQADVRILRRLAQKIAHDLATSVETHLRSNSKASTFHAQDLATYGGAAFALTDAAGAEFMSLAVPVTALAVALKSQMGRARERKTPVRGLSQALRPASVQVEIHLGQADLSLSEAQNIACGDVLVLNTSLADGIWLSIAGSTAPFARGGLSERDGRIFIDLKASRN